MMASQKMKMKKGKKKMEKIYKKLYSKNNPYNFVYLAKDSSGEVYNVATNGKVLLFESVDDSGLVEWTKNDWGDYEPAMVYDIKTGLEVEDFKQMPSVFRILNSEWKTTSESCLIALDGKKSYKRKAGTDSGFCKGRIQIDESQALDLDFVQTALDFCDNNARFYQVKALDAVYFVSDDGKKQGFIMPIRSNEKDISEHYELDCEHWTPNVKMKKAESVVYVVKYDDGVKVYKDKRTADDAWLRDKNATITPCYVE